MLPAPNDSCCSLCLPGEVSSAGAGARAGGISACTPLSALLVLGFGLWRHSWKYSSYLASPLSTMLAYTTANSSLVVFPPLIVFFYTVFCLFIFFIFLFFFFTQFIFFVFLLVAHRDLFDLRVVEEERQCAAFPAWHGITPVPTWCPLTRHLPGQNGCYSAELNQNRQ